METYLLPQQSNYQAHKIDHSATVSNNNACSYLMSQFVWILIRLRLFYFACIYLKKPSRIFKTYKSLVALRNNVWGGNMKKVFKVSGRFYFNMYTPGWPSKAYDYIIKSELKRHALDVISDEKVRFIFLAITRKCAM